MKNQEQELQSPQKPRRLWHKIRRGIVLYALVPYLSVTLIFAVFQRKLIYQPTVSDDLSIEAVGENSGFGRDVVLYTENGETLRGWLLNARNTESTPLARTPLLVYFPGNSINRYERIVDLKEVAACGFDVLIFDYRGFGDSSGSPSEAGLTADARLIWWYATDELNYDEESIVIFGESIGGAVALSLWSEDNSDLPHPAALILSSTFASLPETVASHYPYFPFRFLLLDRWPSIERISQVEAPIIIFHGTDDQIVPLSHAKELADAAPGARFFEISGAGHNDIPRYQLRRELETISASRSVGARNVSEKPLPNASGREADLR